MDCGMWSESVLSIQGLDPAVLNKKKEVWNDVLETIIKQERRLSSIKELKLAETELIYSGPFSDVFRMMLKGTSWSSNYIAKFHRRDDMKQALSTSRNEFEFLGFIYKELHGNSTNYSVVKPIAYVTEHCCIVMDEFKGIRLRDFIKKRVVWGSSSLQISICKELIRCYADWLQDYYLATQSSRREIEITVLADEFYHLLDRCSYLRIIDNSTRQRLKEYFELYKQFIRKLSYSEVANNPDVRLGNVLTDGKRIAVIDFVDMHRGHPLNDVCLFWAGLGEIGGINPFIDSRKIRLLQTHFLSQFSDEDYIDKNALAFFKLLSVLRWANIDISKRQSVQYLSSHQVLLRWISKRFYGHWLKSFVMKGWNKFE